MKLFLVAIAFLLTSFSAAAAGPLDEYNKTQHFAQELHKYVSDQDQYGELDHWAASLTGDCEDYALWVRQIVGGQLVMVRTPRGELHMVLKVGDVVFDNLSRDVYYFQDMPHKLVVIIPDDNPSLLAFSKRF